MELFISQPGQPHHPAPLLEHRPQVFSHFWCSQLKKRAGDVAQWQSAYLTCPKPWVPSPTLQKTTNICLIRKGWTDDLRRPQKAHENDPENRVVWCGRSRPVSQTVISSVTPQGLCLGSCSSSSWAELHLTKETICKQIFDVSFNPLFF